MKFRVIGMAGCVLMSILTHAQDVQIGVFGLFHPQQIELIASSDSALILHVGNQSLTMEKSAGTDDANFHILQDQIVVSTKTQKLRASIITVTGRKSEKTIFTLQIPGKIMCHYHGTLTMKIEEKTLVPVVTMELETAVASVVAAESTPDVPIEALKAQAVATRSYFVAGKGRHHNFDFCDTTHCQFLRDPPSSDSAAAKAVAVTRGLVMTFQSKPFVGMFTRSCSGRTHTPHDLGMVGSAYPYYSVECKYCQEHPFRWQRRISANDAARLQSSNESSRLNLDRRLGWNTVPSNDFSMKKEKDEISLKGVGMGHGIGLCQAGARAMAKEGASFREILSYYYPNSSVVDYVTDH